MDRPEQTLSAVLDAGELLLTSGAEAARVEDTSNRNCDCAEFFCRVLFPDFTQN